MSSLSQNGAAGRQSESGNPQASGEIALELTNIHKHFGQHEVLKGISLTAHKGDVISILGASGSGKSTLLRCVNLLETPTTGQIAIGGEQMRLQYDRKDSPIVDKRQIERLRTRLGMVFQSFNLWSHMTVLENVIKGPVTVLGESRREAVARAESLLEKVGILDRKDYYPAHLSGGQQQRAAIARALAMKPEVLLFDEPTSALDPELVGEVLKVMRQLASEGSTMLVVTHEMEFARDVSSEVVFLYEGLIEEQGDPARVFGSPASPVLKQFLSQFLTQQDQRGV